MAYKLTVCRLGDEWAVRDATGELYGRSPVIDHTIEAAQHLARRHGGRVIMSMEAEIHLRSRLRTQRV